jgi:cardiolipin synthase
LADALQAAAIRGLDVRLMISKRSDLPLVQMASRSYIREMLEQGVKVYYYTQGFLHSKMMVIDGALTIMGSANTDIRSFEDNLEVEAFIYGEAAAARAQEIFLDYQRDCERISLERWKKRSRLKRFAESLMRLFAPLL